MKQAKHKSIILLVVLLSFIGVQWKANAQDIHFSQFTLAPLALNPALTGFYSGDHRAFINYKNQWNGMAEKGAAYRTSMCSYDAKVLTKKIKNGYMGAGFSAFRDVAGDLNLGTTQLNLSLSGIVNINTKQLISGGIQAGFVQKSLNSSLMQWDSQYSDDLGEFDSSLPSNDIATVPSVFYGDVSAGLAWNYSANKSTNYSTNQKKFSFGIAAFHLSRPNQKFKIYTNGTDPLYMKFVAHGSAHIAFGSSGYQILPSFAYFNQGPTMELNLGTMVRWVIKAESRYTGYVQGMALSLGAQYRGGDAIIPMALYEYSDFAIGVSYDVNVSSLRTGTRGRGGFEIALKYVKPVGVSSTRILD